MRHRTVLVILMPAAGLGSAQAAGGAHAGASVGRSGISDSDSGNDTMRGAGVVFEFGKHLTARLEYENFEVRGLDTVELTSAGLEYRF